MKKSIINFLLLAAAIVVLGVSCKKEASVDNAEFQLEDCSVSASVLGTDTKVTLDGVTPKWKTGDKILVLDANKKPLGETGEFTLETGDDSNSGTFKGTKYFGQTPAYAIYPARVYVKTTGKFTLRAAQDGTKATTFNDYAVMMGTVLNGDITFKNVCSILKINTGEYGMTNGEAAIKSLKVSAATTAIAGEFTPDWTNNTIAPAEGGTVSQEVTATATGEGGYDNDTDIYLALIPSASQALTFEFTNTDDEVATVTDTFAPATNTIKGLGTAGGMEFKKPIAFEIYQIYSDRVDLKIIEPTLLDDAIDHYEVRLNSNTEWTSDDEGTFRTLGNYDEPENEIFKFTKDENNILYVGRDNGWSETKAGIKLGIVPDTDNIIYVRGVYTNESKTKEYSISFKTLKEISCTRDGHNDGSFKFQPAEGCTKYRMESTKTGNELTYSQYSGASLGPYGEEYRIRSQGTVVNDVQPNHDYYNFDGGAVSSFVFVVGYDSAGNVIATGAGTVYII